MTREPKACAFFCFASTAGGSAAISATATIAHATDLGLPEPIGTPNGCTAAELRPPASWARTPPTSLSHRMKVRLPDDSELELEDGATGADAAAAIGSGLAKAALAIKVDGTTQDLARPLPHGAEISIITARSGQDALDLIRHDTAHVLAAAVMELYPGVKISIGPPIEN